MALKMIHLMEIFTGQVPIPNEGIRMNAVFAGTTEGELNGVIEGTDYLTVLPNGNVIVDVRAIITTNTGEKISVKANGVSIPSGTPAVSDFYETATLQSNTAAFEYLNQKYSIGLGTSNNATNSLNLRFYRFDSDPLN